MHSRKTKTKDTLSIFRAQAEAVVLFLMQNIYDKS